jgi:hypothetical protein
MPRFVVQQHWRTDDDWHYDLMLEHGDVLLTFSCGAPPDHLHALPCLVRQLHDHRLAYLEHEGEISRQRGWCKIHDRGAFEWVDPAPGDARPDAAPIAFADAIAVRLAGEKARGLYRLTRETTSGTDYWRLRKDA